MALNTFAALKTYILDLADRADLTAYMDDFIVLAEATLNYGSENIDPLRVREMEATATLTASGDDWALPADYLQYRFVRAGNYRLTYQESETFEDSSTTGGAASKFTIVGSTLKVDGSFSGDVDLTYYQKIPALSVSNTDNWLLLAHPNIYIRMVMLELALFIKDDMEAQRSATVASRLIAGLNNADEMANYAKVSMTIEGNVI